MISIVPKRRTKTEKWPMLLGLSTGHDMLLKARELCHQHLLSKDDLSLSKVSGVDVVVIDLG